METIFDSIKLNHLFLKNRIIRSATWEALANKDGSPSRELMDIYENLAKGGIGAIITGFTSVDSKDTYIDNVARINDDCLISEWQTLVGKVHQQEVPVIMQLALGEFVRNQRSIEPDQLSNQQIRELVEMFGDAAKRAEKAGFDGVQIHAAHGFYLSRFISPLYNNRCDDYGGSVLNRTRILLDILADIKKKTSYIHISMKINFNDYMIGGLTPKEAVDICLIMEKNGLDSVEISANGTSVSGIKAGQNEAYFLPYAKQLRIKSSLPIILVGGHRSIESMNNVLKEGIDMVSISRPLICEPDLIRRWIYNNQKPAKCISCNQCYHTYGHKCIFHIKHQEKSF